MPAQIVKDSIDLGIVVRDKEASLKFYRDTLGFKFVQEMQMGNGSVQQRLLCGTSLIKLLSPAETPKVSNPSGGIGAATGYRFWAFIVGNLSELVSEIKAAGYVVQADPREVRPGVWNSIVEDPDGNPIEIIQG